MSANFPLAGVAVPPVRSLSRQAGQPAESNAEAANRADHGQAGMFQLEYLSTIERK
jgi:hypothetical protein